MPSSAWKVIFILGGPGAGKGTQCMKLAKKYKSIGHLSIGDILRAEIERPCSPWASTLKQNMAEGRSGTPSLIVSFLEAAMTDRAKKDKISVFLLDGFPRAMETAKYFESTVCTPSAVLFLDCPRHVQRMRLKSRAQVVNRMDDGPNIMEKRFKLFEQTTIPVIAYYGGQVVHVDASGDEDQVFREIQDGAIGKLLEMYEEKSHSPYAFDSVATPGVGAI